MGAVVTATERASLERMEDKFDARFDRIEDLMEARRVEVDVSTAAIDARLRTVERISYVAGVLGTAGLALGAALVGGYSGLW